MPAIEAFDTIDVRGQFFRHAAPGRAAFAGGHRGRWADDLLVCYLASSLESWIAEAYRHLVDDAGVPADLVRERVLYRVDVTVGSVIDLRSANALAAVWLMVADVQSAVGDYAACQDVAAAEYEA